MGNINMTENHFEAWAVALRDTCVENSDCFHLAGDTKCNMYNICRQLVTIEDGGLPDDLITHKMRPRKFKRLVKVGR